MKGRYRVIITTDTKRYEFETIIERNERASSEELTAALVPEAQRYLKSLGDDTSTGTRGGFTNLEYEYLGPA